MGEPIALGFKRVCSPQAPPSNPPKFGGGGCVSAASNQSGRGATLPRCWLALDAAHHTEKVGTDVNKETGARYT